MSLGYLKGHGTQNDFVVLFDPDSAFEPTEGQVRALCDRRRGLGADGVLRAVPDASGAWFMDFRNADGSVAEMCGNGARLFAVALRDAGLVSADEFPITTRGGTRLARMGSYDGASWTVTVAMGAAHTDERPVSVSVDVGTKSADGVERPAVPGVGSQPPRRRYGRRPGRCGTTDGSAPCHARITVSRRRERRVRGRPRS